MKPASAEASAATPAAAAAAPASMPAASRDAVAQLDDRAVLPEAAPPSLAAAALQEASDRRRQHPWEVTVSGVGVSDERFDTGGFQLLAGVGYYLTEVIELGVRQNVTMSDAGEGVSANWNGASRVALDLHFPLGAFVPYVGANAGYIYGETIDDRFAAGPEAGFKVYVKPDVFLQLAVEYEFFFESSETIDDAFDDATIFYSLGFGVRF